MGFEKFLNFSLLPYWGSKTGKCHFQAVVTRKIYSSWCPAGSVLPHEESVLPQGASLALVGHPSSDGITIKIPMG